MNRPASPTRTDGDAGVVTALVVVIATALLAVAGLAYDGGQIIRANAEARDLATNAARIAAQAVDPTALTTGAVPHVIEENARLRVDDYLTATGHPGTGTITVTGDTVTVTVTLQQAMVLLPLADRQIQATARVRATPGVEEAATP